MDVIKIKESQVVKTDGVSSIRVFDRQRLSASTDYDPLVAKNGSGLGKDRRKEKREGGQVGDKTPSRGGRLRNDGA